MTDLLGSIGNTIGDFTGLPGISALADYSPFIGSSPDIPVPLGPLSNLFRPNLQPSILPRLPNTQRAFLNKYNDPSITTLLSGLDPSIRNSLLAYDRNRVNRGQNPLSTDQTIGALQSAVNKTQATPVEDQGFFGNAMADIRTLLDVPHVISGLVNEAKALPEAPEKLSEALGKGDVQDTLAALQEVPGVRDIPGVFTLSNLFGTGGGIGKALQHPVFTALDVLPYVKEPVAGLLNRAVTIPETMGSRIEAARIADELTRPAKNLVRQGYGYPPLPEPSNLRLAVRSSPLAQAISDTEGFQNIARRFGTEARDATQTIDQWDRTIRAWLSPETPENHPLLHIEGATEGDIPLLRGWFDQMNKYRNTLPPDDQIALTRRLQLEHYPDLVQDPTLTDAQRGFVTAAHDIPANLALYAQAHQWPIQMIGKDVYPEDVAAHIRQTELATNTQRNVAAAREAMDSTVVGQLPRDLDFTKMLYEHQPQAAARAVAEGYMHAINLAGYDTAELRSLIPTAANADKFDRPAQLAVQQAFNNTLANPTLRPILSQDGIAARLEPLATMERYGAGTTAARTLQYINDGDWANAARLYGHSLAQRTTHGLVDNELILDSMRRYREAQHYTEAIEPTFNDTSLHAAENAEALAKRNAIPARFMPAIEHEQKTRLLALFPADAEAIEHGVFSQIHGVTPEILSATKTDAVDAVMAQRAEGFDPTYVHSVDPSRVNEIKYPRLSDVSKNLSQWKDRTMDPSPAVPNAAIAVSHQLAEAMTHEAIKGFIKQFVDLHRVDPNAIVPEFYETAKRLSAVDPNVDPRGYMQTLMRRKYVRYNPHNIFPQEQIHLSSLADVAPGEDIWISRNANQVLKDMFRDQRFDRLVAQWDPVMNAFRYSVLAFSPRNQFNNIFGGAIIAAAENPRILLTMIQRFPEIRKMISEHVMEGIPGAPPSGFTTVGPEIQQWHSTATFADKVLAAHAYMGGSTLRRWFSEFAQRYQPAKTSIFQGIRTAAEKSYAINNWADEMFRIAGYLTGYDKELTKAIGRGMEPEAARQAAQEAGVALVRKFTPNWDRSTPFERNIMRTVFPFYNFSRFLIGYALHYPIDHPFRTAVMTQLVKNEYENSEWLPERFMSMFFLSSPDKDGNVRAFTPNGINPFADVSNYFTLSGWLGKVNPIISAVMESVGIDPSKGSQDLYPDISINPVTGALQPKNINPISAFIQNVIPQTQLIGSLIGRNNDFRHILDTNPEAAAAYLRGSIGFANLSREVNPYQEAFKYEVQRQSLVNTVRNEALRSGDWTRAMRFPTLAPFFNRLGQILQSNPQVLAQYQAATRQGSTDQFFNALLQGALPTGTELP